MLTVVPALMQAALHLVSADRGNSYGQETPHRSAFEGIISRTFRSYSTCNLMSMLRAASEQDCNAAKCRLIFSLGRCGC
jgi:hypothetical protein